MENRIRSLVIAGLILAAAALAAQSDSLKIIMNKEFTLKIGEAGIVERQGFRIEFREVAEDSRCPKGVDCIWAGNAKVILIAREAEKEPLTVELDTVLGTNVQTIGELRISLVSLDPYPVSGSEIAPEDYRATLKISRAD